MSQRGPYVAVNWSGGPRGRQGTVRDLVEKLQNEILSGHLPQGSRLPPVRVLEHALGVSKNTVQAAYDELAARGLAHTREREGVFVLGGPARSEEHAPTSTVLAPMADLRAPVAFPQAERQDGCTTLSTVFIDPELLPKDRLADCIRSVLRTPGLDPRYDWQGHGPLREAIAQRLQRRGMKVSAAEVILTVGSQQALDLVARALRDASLALEDPVYAHARSLFASQGKRLVPLRLNPFEGIPLKAWEASMASAKATLLYAITSYQNPTGYSYTSSELQGILEIAARHGIALLEDDWGAEMLSGSEYRPSLRALGGRAVLYVNSFTKKLWPSLRLGYLVAPVELVPTLVAYKRLSTLGNPWILEAALAEFLDRGYYDTHLTALQRTLDARYKACVECLETRMPEEVRWTLPGGGPTLWLELPKRVALGALRARCVARKVSFEDTASHFHETPHLHGFRVSFAYHSETTLATALGVLAEELTGLL